MAASATGPVTLDHGLEAGFILPEDAPAMKAVADETAATVFPK
jgi:hypothetical protein